MKRTAIFTSLAAIALLGNIANAQLNDTTINTKPMISDTEVAYSTQYQAGINRVTFQSEGTELVGDLYLPANYRSGDKLATVIVSGSWTAVKEQMAGGYAEKLAEQGFAALAFDSRSFGESGGDLRVFESPANKIEDIKNAITFLETVDAVDSSRIAGFGICAGAGYMTTVAAEDGRLGALVTVAPWIHSPAIVNTVYGGEENVAQMIATGLAAADKFAQTGVADYLPATSSTDESAVMYGDIDYYQNPERGAIPEWDNRFAVATWAEWLTFNPMEKANQVEVPTLFVHSENAAIPDGARQFFSEIPTEQKQMVWMNDYQQFDFYDQTEAMDESIALVADHLNEAL